MSLARSGSAKACLERGKACAAKRQDLDAMEYFRLAILQDTDPVTKAESYLCRGKVYRKQELFVNAIDDFTAAIEINPAYWDAYYCRGMLYASDGRYSSEAKADLQRISSEFKEESRENKKILYKLTELNRSFCIDLRIKLTPEKCDSADKYLAQAREALQNDRDFGVYTRHVNLDLAVVYYHKALDLDPDCAKAYYEIGNIYCGEKKYQLAIDYYSRAISKKAGLSPQELRMAYFYSGKIHYWFAIQEKAGNIDKHVNAAYQCYTKIILTDPRDQEAYYERGKTRSVVNEAMIDYSKAIDLEDGQIQESTEIKRSASERLTFLLKDRTKEEIFSHLKQIKDEAARVYLLKKCLDENDPGLGKFFQAPASSFQFRKSIREKIQDYLVDLAKAKINKKRQDILSSIYSLSFQASDLISSDDNLYCVGEEFFEDENTAFQALCFYAKDQLEIAVSAATQAAQVSYTVESEQKMEDVQVYLREWLVDKKKSLAEKLSDGPLATVRSLLDQLARYIPPELLKAQKNMVSKVPAEEMEGYIAQLQSELNTHKRNAVLEEKTQEGAEQAEARQMNLQENISAALAKLRLLDEDSEKVADAYEGANNAARSIYKLNQQISDLDQVGQENARLEKLDREIRVYLDDAIEKNSCALLEKVNVFLTRYTSNRREHGVEEYDDYVRTVHVNIFNPDFKKQEKFLDWVNLVSKELLIKCFEMEYPLLCKKIRVFLDLRECSTAKTQDLKRYDEYYQSCNDLLADFNERGLETFSLKTLEALCNAKIDELNEFYTGQWDVLTQENKASLEWLTKQHEKSQAAYFHRLQHPENPARAQILEQKANDAAASRAKKEAVKFQQRGTLFDPNPVSTPDRPETGGTELPPYPISKRPGE